MIKNITLFLLSLFVQTNFMSHALAKDLPAPKQLISILGQPQLVRVREPHLSSLNKAVYIDYLGYPIEKVLHRLQLQYVEPSQREKYYIEFVCADGYISRIPAEKFHQFHAFLVFDRHDKKIFSVPNLAQKQADIALGPYYLVWDNKDSAELQKLGTYHWPYQVLAIAVKGYQGDIKHARLANDYCLTCHQLNGDGGKVYPINLAQIGMRYPKNKFVQWVLNPAAIKPNSPMPALNPLLPDAEREQIAQQLYQYFNQITLQNPSL